MLAIVINYEFLSQFSDLDFRLKWGQKGREGKGGGGSLFPPVKSRHKNASWWDVL